MLIIVVCGTQLSHEERLDCEFGDKYTFIVGVLYSCVVTSLDNPYNNLNIDGYSGEHKGNKSDADVKVIHIYGTNTKYIPTNLGSFSNLTALRMVGNKLVDIKAKDFHEMQNLESISFESNKLSSVPLDVFATLTKLRSIDLSYNQIEELPNGIFKNNMELEIINLWNNKIKHLGTEIFHDLKKINYVDLEDNICVNKRYNGATEINKMKHDIKMNCDIPNDAIDFKLNEMMNKLLNAMDVEKKDRVEIEKLRTALVEAKVREQVKVFEVSNLKQDLLQMNERIPKLELETYEQRRMERSALIEVKGKLKRAEEQLAQCLKDNPGM